ncbi:Protein of unknown function [Cotesia congregata]|uniref:Mutator-like transposase domain-containing protein n=1 Tax=Cotesia congregata TaxID=51543 RepID=A0A8J2GZD2_COTCN|nr:Protein of unknown function [Cotesia congregata]
MNLKISEFLDQTSKQKYRAIHSGVGNTSLNKILACENLPQMRRQQYKKYESIVGKAIESEARDSCKRAASEERDRAHADKIIITNHIFTPIF